MNKILLFTDSKVPLKYFQPFEKSKKWDFRHMPLNQFRKELKSPDAKCIYMIDYESIPDHSRTKDLNYLLRKQGIPKAVIDRKNTISDPASLMMKGCDYYNTAFLKEGLKPARLSRYLEFFSAGCAENPGESTDQAINTAASKHIISSNGWQDIKSGKKYSFYMLFTEISFPANWKIKSGNAHMNNLKQVFHDVVERTVAQYDGRIWIWNEYGGLILFPYDGTTCCSVTAGIKLMMNRVIFTVKTSNCTPQSISKPLFTLGQPSGRPGAKPEQ